MADVLLDELHRLVIEEQSRPLSPAEQELYRALVDALRSQNVGIPFSIKE